MSVVITKDNIYDWTHTRYTVRELIWKAGPLDTFVMKKFPNVTRFDCSSNGLTSLMGIGYFRKLIELVCSNNDLCNLEGIEGCSKLEIIDCSSNEITSIDNIKICTNLRDFNCSYNQLRTLNGSNYCSRLEKVDCSTNLLETIQDISDCKTIKTLICSNNLLTDLFDITRLINLEYLDIHNNEVKTSKTINRLINIKHLDISFNYLTCIEDIEYCSMLKHLSCHNNYIETMDNIVYLRNLTVINYYGNLPSIKTKRLIRYLERVDIIHQESIDAKIYSDNKTLISNITIVDYRNIDPIVKKILLSKNPQDMDISVLVNCSLLKITIETLLKYCQDPRVHDVHFITFSELLGYVWELCCSKNTLKQLETVVKNPKCETFEGRFGCFMNLLCELYHE